MQGNLERITMGDPASVLEDDMSIRMQGSSPGQFPESWQHVGLGVNVS